MRNFTSKNGIPFHIEITILFAEKYKYGY